MATKAELEVELAKLRSELKELRNHSAATVTDDPASQSADQSPLGDRDSDASGQEGGDIFQSMKDGHFEDVLHQLTEELGDLPARKPLLTALGALVVGYLIGRSGHRG